MRRRATGKQMIQKDIRVKTLKYIFQSSSDCAFHMSLSYYISNQWRGWDTGLAVFLTEVDKLGAMQEGQMTECHVLQQRSPAQGVVSLHLPQAFPQTTTDNRRYVQWLPFNSFLLRVQPCATFPQRYPWIRSPNVPVFHDIQHQYSFICLSLQGQVHRRCFFHTGQRWISFSPPLPSFWCVCRVPVSNSLFSLETLPLHAASV